MCAWLSLLAVLKCKPTSESPGRLGKTQIADPSPASVSDHVGLGRGLRVPYKFPADADATGPDRRLKTAALGKAGRFSSSQVHTSAFPGKLCSFVTPCHHNFVPPSGGQCSGTSCWGLQLSASLVGAKMPGQRSLTLAYFLLSHWVCCRVLLFVTCFSPSPELTCVASLHGD